MPEKIAFTVRALLLVFFASGFLTGCSHQAVPLVNRSNPAAREPESVEASSTNLPSRELLNEKEFEEPSNPVIKWQLSLYEWCEKDHGAAVEHWNWIRQFTPNTPLGVHAEGLLGKIKASGKVGVADGVDCGKIFQKMKK